MLFFLKNREKLKKLLFFRFIPFSAPQYFTKAQLICLQNGFSHSIPSMFHVCRSRDIRPSPFWSYEDLNFEKSLETPNFSTFSTFQMKYFF